MIEVIDTYPRFKELMSGRGDPLDAWVDYLSEYSELLEILKSLTGSSFTYLMAGAVERSKELINEMNRIHDSALNAVRDVGNKLLSNLGVELGAKVVIYVGFGLGAVLPTKYLGSYAVLFDLLGAAEAGLIGEAVEEVIAHGICHLIHSSLMGVDPIEYNKFREDPVFLIYSEGFATRCECLLLNKHPRTLPISVSELYDLAKFVSGGLSRDDLINAFTYSRDEGVRNHGYALGMKLFEYLESRLGGLLNAGKLRFNDVLEVVSRVVNEVVKES